MSLQNFLGVMKCSCILLCEQKSLKFKFDLNSNWFVIYKTALKKKNIFLFEFGFWAESSVRPAGLPVSAAYAAQRFAGAHRVAKPNPTR
jgi:hypothetical protein